MAMVLSKMEDLGSSSHSIVSVQEVVKGPIIKIPQQFVRSDQQSLSNFTPPSTTLPPTPTIDMSRLVSSHDDDDDDEELLKLHSIFQDWGIFQLVNHGVSSSLLEKVKYEVEEFFKLPFEEKMKYKAREGEMEGYGRRASRSGGKYDWVDSISMITNPLHRRRPHLFPQLPSSLRDALEGYISEVQKLGKQLLCSMAKALKMDMEEMMELIEDGRQAMRMAYYPPCPQPELVIGHSPHSDQTLLTIVHQVNGVNGLEVKKDGLWIPLDIKPDAFVVNAGDILEILSNGVYRSVEHKVSVNSEKERMSIIFSLSPNFEANVGPAHSLVSKPNNPPLFKEVGMEQYWQDFFKHKQYGKSYLEHLRIQNE